jgi:hypothetical protein
VALDCNRATNAGKRDRLRLLPFLRRPWCFRFADMHSCSAIVERGTGRRAAGEFQISAPSPPAGPIGCTRSRLDHHDGERVLLSWSRRQLLHLDRMSCRLPAQRATNLRKGWTSSAAQGRQVLGPKEPSCPRKRLTLAACAMTVADPQRRVCRRAAAHLINRGHQ